MRCTLAVSLLPIPTPLVGEEVLCYLTLGYLGLWVPHALDGNRAGVSCWLRNCHNTTIAFGHLWTHPDIPYNWGYDADNSQLCKETKEGRDWSYLERRRHVVDAVQLVFDPPSRPCKARGALALNKSKMSSAVFDVVIKFGLHRQW